MIRRRSFCASQLLLLVLSGCGEPAGSTPPPTEPVAIDGLVAAPGAELVARNCVACHGPRQFLQQRGDRETWRGLIRWMQRDHGMWPLAADVEERIVAYLATHYAPRQRGRRRALPSEAMPPNPFAAPVERPR